MKVDLQTIEHLARLSKLHFSEEEKAQLVLDVQRMVSFVEQLNAPGLEELLPLQHMTPEARQLRSDVPSGEFSTAEALQNAPLANDGYFMVPKVISI